MTRQRTLPALLLLAGAAFGQTARHVVIVDLDGVPRDTFAQAYGGGVLPNFARALGGAVWFDQAVTVTPSVTMAGQASIITGTPPSRHGVVGNQWFERDGSGTVDYLNASGIICVYGFSVLGGEACLKGWGNRHLQAPTIYETAAAAGLRSVVVFHPFWKGAARPAAPTIAEATAFLSGEIPDYRIFDRKMTERAVAELRSGGMPAILTLYFAGADGVAHKRGIAAQIPYLADTIDPLLGRVIDAMEGLDREWRSSTMVVLTADHGRTDVAPQAGDRTLAADLLKALPAGARIAVNGGIGYLYLPRADAESLAQTAESLQTAFAGTVASVRPRNTDDARRVGDLVVTLREGHYFGNRGSGSQHGSVYPQDLGVPLVVAAPGLAAGRRSELVRVTQIARTVAEYLGFAMETADPALPIRTRARTATRQ